MLISPCMRWRNASGFCPILVTIGVGLSALASACARTDTHGQDTAVHAHESSEFVTPTARVPPTRATPVPQKLAPAEPPGAVSRAPTTLPATGASPSCVVASPPEPPPPALPAASCPADPTGPPELDWGAISFVEAPGSPRIRIELAATDPTRARGLMYRTALEQDQGMLFVFPDQEKRSFWMKNTCIPLDMLFVDQGGTIVGILENVPTLNLRSRGVPCPAAYVLEVNAGWTRDHGVFAGQHLEIER